MVVVYFIFLINVKNIYRLSLLKTCFVQRQEEVAIIISSYSHDQLIHTVWRILCVCVCAKIKTNIDNTNLQTPTHTNTNCSVPGCMACIT